MQLMILETTPESLRAGYECPCGCRPSVAYVRHGDAARDACCCGNEFAVGPTDEVRLASHGVFQRETESLLAPWGEPLEAVWLIGPSTHGGDLAHEEDALGDHDATAHGHGLEMAHATSHDPRMGAVDGMAIDPVCGMTVEPESARARGLHSQYKGVDYFFCGKGCKLDFDEDPERYFDPRYVPSM